MTGKRRIDRITGDNYLESLATRPMPDIRALREECTEEETSLSYMRKLLQARIDILGAELARRSGKEGSLLDLLPKILADSGPPSSRGSYSMLEPDLTLDHPKRRVEKLVSDDTLAQLPALETAEIETIVQTLSEAEREISEFRKSVHGVLNKLTAEIVRRYASGEADPADLLAT
ncbi:MAG: hypothetical protein NVSMB57_01430 [Actinomycetota bacterium]